MQVAGSKDKWKKKTHLYLFAGLFLGALLHRPDNAVGLHPLVIPAVHTHISTAESANPPLTSKSQWGSPDIPAIVVDQVERFSVVHVCLLDVGLVDFLCLATAVLDPDLGPSK